MSSFYSQSIRLNSSLLGKRNSPATSFNLQEHLKNQFQRSCPSTALNSDESRKTSYDHREEDCSRSSSGATPNSLGPNLSQLSSSLNNHNRIQDSVFGRNSDMNENEFERFRSYAADLRFAPAGPRPPVPPVGGLFNYNQINDQFIQKLSEYLNFMNDAAGTIKNNNSCLQSIYNKINNKQNIITSIPIVVEQQQSQNKISNSGFTENSIYPNNQTEISHNSSFTNSTSPNLMNNENFSIDLINLENQSTGSSPQIELSTDHEELSSKFDEPQNIFAQFENFDGSRRRDTKFEAKITASAKAPENNGKISCKGCHLLYHKLKFQGFCHNCYKIYEAVEQFVSLNNGKFEFVDKKCNFVLTCENSHQWKVDFKTKHKSDKFYRVKKWCKTCKKSARATRKEYLKMMDEEEQKRKIEMQRELFNRARVPGQSHYAAGGNSSSSSSSPSSGSFFNNAYEECDLEDDDLHGGDLGGHHHGHGHYHVDSEEDKRQSEIFFSVLTGEEGEERKFSQEMMDQMVEYILNQTDSRLIRFFQQVSEDKRMRAFRRVARIVHPDKNHHPYAKDAFQKIFNCSIRSKPKNQKIWFWFGLLIEAEEVRCF